MPYKDKEKQKESVRNAVGKHRKGITVPKNVIPCDVIPE